MKRLILILALLVTPNCATAPPNLTPIATAAFNKARVQKALDVIRDTAQDANAQVPPVLGTATTRRITQWHESAVTIIKASDAGWQTVVTTSLDQLLKDLPTDERALFQPYVTLAKTIIKGVAP